MRIQHIPALLVVLILASGATLTSIDLWQPPDTHARQDQGDDDRGHGNDPDGIDEDNPGRNQPGVVVSGGYLIEVDCDFDEDDNVTECDISADDTWDVPDVDRLTVPAEAVCADVLDGKFVHLAPETGAEVTGFASEEGDDDLELVMSGRVAVDGTASYQVTTVDGVIPVEGPGLVCDPAGAVETAPPQMSTATETATAAAPSPTPTQPPSTPVPTTGSLSVVTYTCTDVPEDRTDFDWFERCGRGADPMTFSLTSAGSTGKDAITLQTDSGEVTFEELEPGEYELDAVDASWCHATSDNVTAESTLVVEAGATTRVWLFMCDGTTGV